MTDLEPTKAKLSALLPHDEIITPDSADYQPNIQTWSSQKQQNPPLVVRPASVESLSKAVACLYSTDLDIAIYGQGFMSASAKDVLINTSALNDFYFDKQSETVTVGAGQTWSEVLRKLGAVAPEYGVVGARTPCVGVAGTIVTGGFSWLSAEYGCISDPENMLDARVVKHDGSIVWASEEPELSWALRGGGGGFGVIAQVVLRAFRYPQNIWTGSILVPRDQLQRVAEGLAQFVSKPVDPRVTMFLYVVKGKLVKAIGVHSDMLLIHAFDAHGEEHGRASFKWALDIPGAIDQTKVTNLTGVANLQDNVHTAKGTMKQFWAPLILREVTKDTVINAIKWSEDIQRLDQSLGDCTFLIFELLASRDPAGSIASCAWPRPPGTKHILLIATGCPSTAGEDKERLAKDLATSAASNILGDDVEHYYLPNGLEDFQDPRKIWGAHFSRLQDLRRLYDPRGKFKGAIGI